MILIIKGSEPVSLTEYKKRKYASYGRTEVMDDIRNSLLRDQKYICAYCMRRITNDRHKMKIEHWLAQSQMEKEQSKLDYKIMLAVCDGCRGSIDKYTTCDEHRHNKELYVNPLDKDMMATIYYDRNGFIHSNDPRIERDLNETLNLNCENASSKIVVNRKKIYKTCYTKLSEIQDRGKWTKRTLHKVLRLYEPFKSHIDDSDEHITMEHEYVGVVRFIINKHIKR